MDTVRRCPPKYNAIESKERPAAAASRVPAPATVRASQGGYERDLALLACVAAPAGGALEKILHFKTSNSPIYTNISKHDPTSAQPSGGKGSHTVPHL